jgi:hypothetical protein
MDNFLISTLLHLEAVMRDKLQTMMQKSKKVDAQIIAAKKDVNERTPCGFAK